MEEQQEVWKDIIMEKNGVVYDYTGLYQISNMGKIKSYVRDKNGKIMNPRKCNGYLSINLVKNSIGKMFYVHRIVATMFIENPSKLPEVNHIDENKSNNNVSNLEWCDRKYNCNHGTRNERRAKKMLGVGAGKPNCRRKPVICLNTMQIFDYVREAQEWCGGGNISGCCKCKQKYAGHHPETNERLRWMYYEDWLKLQENEKIAN